MIEVQKGDEKREERREKPEERCHSEISSAEETVGCPARSRDINNQDDIDISAASNPQ